MVKLSDLARGRGKPRNPNYDPDAPWRVSPHLSKGRGRMRGHSSRFARALAESTLEHDGAYRDPMAMEMIADRYKVDLADLTRAANKVVDDRAAENERNFQKALAEATEDDGIFRDHDSIVSIAIERGVDPDELVKAVDEHRQAEQASSTLD